MRSPSESIAADIADTRSSSTPAGSDDAMIRPSTETTAEASTSGVPACKSRKRSTICSVRDLGMSRSFQGRHDVRGKNVKDNTTSQKSRQAPTDQARSTVWYNLFQSNGIRA